MLLLAVSRSEEEGRWVVEEKKGEEDRGRWVVGWRREGECPLRCLV